MAKLSIEERIAQLEMRKRALKARLSKNDRAKDTRRKVLMGAFLLQQLEANRDADFQQRLTAWLKRELPGFLTRDDDKKLFPEFIPQSPSGSTAEMATSSAPNEEGRKEERDRGGSGDHGSQAS